MPPPRRRRTIDYRSVVVYLATQNRSTFDSVPGFSDRHEIIADDHMRVRNNFRLKCGMATRFKHPPLVEVIAELRWTAGVKTSTTDTGATEIRVPISAAALSRADEFLMRFASAVGEQGYSQVERLLPPGVPAIPFQPMYRFRKRELIPITSTLYQLGAGIFSVNITPPYQSWSDFRPVVHQGLSALLRCRSEDERETPFTQLTLRYIDAFRENLLQNLSPRDFLRDVLGFQVAVPDAVSSLVAKGAQIVPQVNLTAPLQSGARMSLTVGEGRVNNEFAVILDTSIQDTRATKPALDTVMSAFDAAHDVLGEMFQKITKKLHPLMEPQS